MKINLSKKDKLFIGAVALVHGVFFLLALSYKRIYMGDSFEYIYESLNIKQYFFFYSGNAAMPIVPEYMTQRQPLYPLLLLGVYAFTINNWIVIVLQNLLSVFNIYYARKIFISIGYKETYDGLLLLFVIAYPAQFINANTIAPDILLQTFTLVYFGNFLALFQKKQIRYAIWMGGALIAGFLVKPVLYPFVVVHFLIVIIVAAVQRTKMQRHIIIALMPLVAVLLYNYWNLTRTEKFHFTSNQAFNASYYFYPFISQKEGVDSANRFLQNERKEYASIPEYKDRYDYANERGTALLKQNFFPYMEFHLKNTARIFVEPGKGEMDLFTGKLTYGRLYSKEQTGFYATWKNIGWGGMSDYLHNNPSLFFVVLVFLFNCLRLIGFIWFLLSKRIHWLVRTFISVLVAYFAFAAGPIANTRYFLPVSLIVIGAGVMGLVDLKNRKVKENMS
jgi:hypothetical protein